jgi:hypothetical protein
VTSRAHLTTAGYRDIDYCAGTVTAAVPCPSCKAEAGWPCFTKTGKPTTSPHAPRIELWRARQLDEAKRALLEAFPGATFDDEEPVT